MVLRAGLEQVWKISPPTGLDPQTLQPVASRSTGCTIPALALYHIRNELSPILCYAAGIRLQKQLEILGRILWRNVCGELGFCVIQ